MENAKISNLYDLDQTIAKELFEGLTYPWEALAKISDFIRKLGPTLDAERYEQRGEDVWVAKSATVAPTAFLNGPLTPFRFRITIMWAIPFLDTSRIWERARLPLT